MQRRRLLSCLLASLVPGQVFAGLFTSAGAARGAVATPVAGSGDSGHEPLAADAVDRAGDAPTPAARRGGDATPAGAQPWHLIAPLRKGQEVGLGWRLAGFSRVRRGAATLTLTRRGATASIDVCARRGRPRGIASSRYFDLVLMNDADGSTVTDESLGRVIKTLAQYVKRNEKTRARRLAARRGMLSHETRVALYVNNNNGGIGNNA